MSCPTFRNLIGSSTLSMQDGFTDWGMVFTDHKRGLKSAELFIRIPRMDWFNDLLLESIAIL